jgi:hypothetical protein
MHRNFTTQDASNINKSILLISALADILVEKGVLTSEERSTLIDRTYRKDDMYFDKCGCHLINREHSEEK